MTKKPILLTTLAISGILLLSPSVAADNDPASVKDRCGEHARKVVDEIHREVFNSMTAKQSRQTESLIINNCLRQFASGKSDAAMTNDTTAEEDDDDWFTRYVLEGKGADKPGNRRLERLRRK